ncbi:MAG TPA: AAA family ATPase [Candidatus Saccharicenans sp.]|nr:AAA family ATPase [Candidatus Saccharicenans sp.]
MSEIKSLLLLGPPGAGKSPFGQYLSRQKIKGRRFFIFDFGQELRQILEGQSEGMVRPDGRNGLQEHYDEQELERIRQVVEKALLFEEPDRELVRKILMNFLSEINPSREDVLILNGLPRHPGQVFWLKGLARIVLAVNLDCPEGVSIRRILANLDGERTGRQDDRPDIISHRYKIHEERTRPLLNWLEREGIPLINLPVSYKTRPEELLEKIISNEAFKLLFSD